MGVVDKTGGKEFTAILEDGRTTNKAREVSADLTT